MSEDTDMMMGGKLKVCKTFQTWKLDKSYQLPFRIIQYGKRRKL